MTTWPQLARQAALPSIATSGRAVPFVVGVCSILHSLKSRLAVGDFPQVAAVRFTGDYDPWVSVFILRWNLALRLLCFDL